MTDSLIPLLSEDVRRVVLELGPMLNVCKHSGVYVAGGFVRAVVAGEEIQDIDLHFSGVLALDEVRADLRLRGYQCKATTSNAETWLGPVGTLPVQLILRWMFPQLSDCISSFDYTIARAGVSWDSLSVSWTAYADARFYPDLAAKRLFYRAPVRDEDAGGSMLRALKFARRGYRIDPANLAAVMARAVRGMPGEGRNEGAIASDLQRVLYEVDPLRVVQGIPVDEVQSLQDIRVKNLGG